MFRYYIWFPNSVSRPTSAAQNSRLVSMGIQVGRDPKKFETTDI